ncbi:MAG: hypothetical protein AB1467_04565 [Candidatus Diapherotrites archaeon]
MSAKIFIAIVLVGIIIAGAIVFSIKQKGPETAINTATVEDYFRLTAQKNALAGEEFTVKIEAREEKGIKKINYESTATKKEILCGQKECGIEIKEKISQEGIFELKAVLTNNSGEQKTQKTIISISKARGCNETKNQECSAQKPFYCENGILIENCIKCGCTGGKCNPSTGKCIEAGEENYLLSINSINSSPYAQPGNAITIEIDLINDSGKKTTAGGKYLLEINFKGNESITNTYSFGLNKDLQPEEKAGIEVKEKDNSGKNFTITREGTYTTSAILYLLEDNNKTKLSELSQGQITIRNDSSPPSAPTGLKAARNGNIITLQWNSNTEEDLKEYKVYESTSIQAGYIAYSYKKSVGKENTTTEMSEDSNQEIYFVITALDYFGNESGYSNIAKTS